MKIGIVTGDIAALARWTLDCPEIDNFIGPKAIVFLALPLTALKVLKIWVGSNINFVPLIIEICTFGDKREIIKRKLWFSKVRHVIIGLDLLNKPNASFICLSRLTVFWYSRKKLSYLLEG